MILVIEHHKSGHKTRWKVANRDAVVNEIRKRYSTHFDAEEWLDALEYHLTKLDLYMIETREPDDA